jgi:hypothetical protein
LQLREKCRELHALNFEAQSKVPTTFCAVIGSGFGSAWAYRSGNSITGILTGIAVGCILTSDFASSRYAWPTTSTRPEFEIKVAKLSSQKYTFAQIASELNRTMPRRAKGIVGAFPAVSAYLSYSAEISEKDIEDWARYGGYEKLKNE